MNLTTCCPTCGTLFRVVPDQLRISDGWVRCGRCAKVFDARASLQENSPPDEADPAALPPLSMAVEPGKPVVASVAVVPAGAESAALPVGAVPGPRLPPDDGLDAELTATLAAIAREIARQAPEPSPPPPSPSPSPSARTPEHAVDPPPARRRVRPKTAESARRVPSTETGATVLRTPESEPAFVQQAVRRAFWRKSWVRVGLGLACMGLIVSLAVQIALQERDRIVAYEPGLEAAVLTLCRALDCQVGALRQADAVVIDNSTFTRLPSGAFQLGLVLRNTATVPLATPAIEVTLTDGRDQPVVRRVVLPAEFAPANLAMDARGELSRGVVLSMTDEAEGARVSGYRVVAFYP